MILPALSWYSCFNSIVMHGALPVFAEANDSLNIDSADLESKITAQTKVIMVVHALGCPADLDPIMALARRRGLKVLEDCAQSLGGSYQGKSLGSIGDIGIYSFQMSKTISSGEGGGVVTSDPLLFERASRYHDLGLLRPPHAQMLGKPALTGMIGSQYRMSEFTGGVLLAQLRKLDMIVGALRGHARTVYEGLTGLPDLQLRHRPDPQGDIGTGIWLGFASPAQRDKFLAAMRRRERARQSATGRGARTASTGCREKADGSSQLAVVRERARSVDSLWRGMLSQNNRPPAPIRGYRARPEVHEPRRGRHRGGDTQGPSGRRSGLTDRTLLIQWGRDCFRVKLPIASLRER